MEKRTYSTRQLIAIRRKAAAKKAAQVEASAQPAPAENAQNGKRPLTYKQIGAIIAKRKAKAATLAA